MKISTQSIKVKVNGQWVPFIGANTGETVLYSLQRGEDGSIQLVGTDGSISSLPIASLTIGEHVYNGTEDVDVEVYNGNMDIELDQPKTTLRMIKID